MEIGKFDSKRGLNAVSDMTNGSNEPNQFETFMFFSLVLANLKCPQQPDAASTKGRKSIQLRLERRWLLTYALPAPPPNHLAEIIEKCSHFLIKLRLPNSRKPWSADWHAGMPLPVRSDQETGETPLWTVVSEELCTRAETTVKGKK